MLCIENSTGHNSEKRIFRKVRIDIVTYIANGFYPLTHQLIKGVHGCKY